MSDPVAFRAQFPVLERLAYLNAGSCGPLARGTVDAAKARMVWEMENGRSGHLYQSGLETLAWEARERIGALIGAEASSVALTHSTTDGINLALRSLDLEPGQEILTSTEEHPGLLGPLAWLSRHNGVRIRQAPLERIHEEATGETALIACSHVGWITGRRAPVAELAESPVSVLYDGAQAAGALEVDVRELDCDFYASGCQKWMCGPAGTGFLFARVSRTQAAGVPWPNFDALADPERPLDLEPKAGAARFSPGGLAGPQLAALLSSLRTMEDAGWEWIHAQARRRASELRARLSGRVEILPSQDTLVSIRVTDPDGWVRYLAEREVFVRSVPGGELLRASIGAWTSDRDLERLCEPFGAA